MQKSEKRAACAFLGLGVMGYRMAGHLARKGYRVTVYNRTQEKARKWAEEFAQFGGSFAPTPAQAAQGCDFVFACVGEDKDLRSVVLGDDGALSVMKPGSIFIDNTTDSAEVAREMHALLKEKGCGFLDAPVSGGEAGAVNGVLTVMVGGDADVFEKALEAISSYACAVTHVGGPGCGQLAKMCNQICIGGLVAALSEAVAFGINAGLDMKQVLKVLEKGAAGSWQMANRGETMVDDRFDFGFAVNWMRKDLGIAMAEARRNGSSLPVTALVDQFYADVATMGGGRLDTSSLIKRLPCRRK